MTGPTAVSPTAQKPRWDFTITDGSDTLGFVIVNPSTGQPNPTQFQLRPISRTAIKTVVGESKYSDLEEPYLSIVQEDWSGGRGNKDFEDDRSRFYDANRVLTNIDGQIILGPAVTNSRTGASGFHKYFVYKNCVYAVNIIDGSNSILYRNGYLGAADSNTGALTKLNDATRSWTPDALIGGVVILLEGPGSEESQPWRTITDNDGTSLTTSAWKVTHTTSTVYAVVNVDIWTNVLDLGGHVTDIMVADENVYFARGETASLKVLRYNEYNLSGVWTERNSAENMDALFMQVIRNEQENYTYLYGARNAVDPYKSTLWKMQVPPTWNALYQNLGTLVSSDIAWSDRIITNVTQSTEDGETKMAIAAGFTTGVVGVKNLATPIDITQANAIGMMIKSSVAVTDAAHLKLFLEDVNDLGRSWYVPASVMAINTQGDPHIISLYEASDGDTATYNYLYAGYYLYVGNTSQFDVIDVDLDATINNDQASAMAAEYYNGEWTSLTITDNTADGGDTLAQDGTITFTKPNDWLAHSVQGTTIYWVRLKPSVLIEPSVKLYQVTVKDTAKYYSPQLITQWDNSATDYVDQDNVFDGDTATSTIPTGGITTDDYYYYCASTKYDIIDVDMKTGNDAVAVLTLEYFNGSRWTAVSDLVDGTKVANNGDSDPLKQDGQITFTQPYDWEKIVIAGSGSNPYEYYTVRLSYDAAIDATTDIYEMRHKNTAAEDVRDPSILVAIHTSNAASYQDLPALYDGDPLTYHDIIVPTGTGEDDLYIGSTTLFNKIYIELYGTYNNVGNASSCDLEYWNGEVWTNLAETDGTISGGLTFGQSGEISFTPQNDWEKLIIDEKELYWVRMSGGSIYAKVDSITIKHENNIELNVGTLLVNTPTWVEMAITPSAYPIPDETRITSVGLELSHDYGAQNIWIIDDVKLIYTYADQTDIRIPSNERIIGIGAYSGEETGGVSNPWVRTDKGVYEVQTQNNDAVVKLPLDELREMQSYTTAMTTNGVYLMFALGEEKLERYYNKNLDDIGPDGDEGLPEARRGRVSALMSYPGGVFVVVDGGASNSSSILLLDGSSYHDIYYTTAGTQIQGNMVHQVIPGQATGKVFFSEGVDIKWYCWSPNPFFDPDFVYASSGWLETSWFYANMIDIVKLWKSLKVFGEELNATTNLTAHYKLDGDSSWTAISGTFDTEPSEELDFASTFPTGKRLKLKLTLATSDTTKTPRVLATLIEGYGIVPVKYEYIFPSTLMDHWQERDLDGDHAAAFGYSNVVDTALTKLLAWVDGATPLTMNSRYKLFDDNTVVLQAPVIQPLDNPGPEQKDQSERHIIQIALHDV